MTTTSGMTELFVRRPLASFFVLTFVVSPLLLFAPPLAATPFGAAERWAAAGEILVAWAPNLAALIIVGVTRGRAGVRRPFDGFLKWRLPAKYYVLALGIPFAILVACVLVLTAWQHPVSYPFVASFTPAGFLLVTVDHLIRGPIGEEAGWRGFALPLLLERYSLFRAGFLLGLVWSLWHFPYWFITVKALFPGEPHRMIVLFVSFAVVVPPLSCILGWVYIQTRSLVPVMLMHLSFNLAPELVVLPYDRLFAALAAGWVLLAGGWFLATRSRHVNAVRQPERSD